MKRLLSIELNKLRNYRAFWILSALYFLGVAGCLLSIQGIMNTLSRVSLFSFNSFPDVWHYFTYIAGFFHYILAVIVIILICSEFNFKTVRQNIISGMSRAEWLVGKILLMFFFALASTMVVGLCCLMMGFSNSSASQIGIMMTKAHFILAYFIQLVGYLLFAMLLSMLIRNTGIVIGIYSIYTWILEKVLAYYLGDDIGQFLPFQAFGKMIRIPFLDAIPMGIPPQTGPDLLAISVSCFYVALFGGLCYWFLAKRDL
jgi:ABC-2 type transport system permease protein